VLSKEKERRESIHGVPGKVVDESANASVQGSLGRFSLLNSQTVHATGFNGNKVPSKPLH
jgi:hypothetical protein